MGRLTTLALAVALLFGGAVAPARAGGGFGGLAADAAFGESMTFTATWSGAAPDHLELLLGFGTEERLAVQLEPARGDLRYVRDLTGEYVTPNTEVSYQWRATAADAVTLSPQRTLLYDDDRSHLDWERARVGSATVHWYDDNEAAARRFGALAGDAADAAGELLGRPLAEPIDIFVYDARDDFFGAIGPGSREWTGAATYPHIRTIFMWLGAGGDAFLELALVHEVTHVVFADATANPFHEPASWLNEGVATWSERQDAAVEEDLVRFEAGRGGLMAFAALVHEFPIDARGASLAYAQGATMVDYLIETYGTDVMADIADAYRSGATEDEAIEAASGTPFGDIRVAYFDQFGVTEPEPIEPVARARSDVPLPPQPGGEPGPTAAPVGGSGDGQGLAWWLIIVIVAVGVVFGVTVVLVARRIQPPAGGAG